MCCSSWPPAPFAGEEGRDGVRKTLLEGEGNAAGVQQAWRSTQKAGGSVSRVVGELWFQVFLSKNKEENVSWVENC